MLKIYTTLLSKSEPFLNGLLQKRLSKGKETAERLDERKGIASLKRPNGALIWLHAASVGEAQSSLILVRSLLNHAPDIHILVTTGTQSSAKRMEAELPDRAFHQFVPLDHPEWVARFLDHWQPDAALWMESELWPNKLLAIKARNIPAALVNARLSNRSLGRWTLAKNSIKHLLSSFDVILAQSGQDARNFEKLGAQNVIASGNIKYSAAPLSCDEEHFRVLKAAIGNRPSVVYASTHDGEEEIIAQTHSILENAYPDLLSIVIPRHPERGDDIAQSLQAQHHGIRLRGHEPSLPDEKTRIYIANTLGEMGLFYRLGEIVYVGRSLSNDGGGGHNPLEPALLNCAVIHGKNIQNLKDIYDDMQAANACISVDNKDDLAQKVEWLLSDTKERNDFIARAHAFASAQSHVVDTVMDHILPLITKRNKNAA